MLVEVVHMIVESIIRFFEHPEERPWLIAIWVSPFIVLICLMIGLFLTYIIDRIYIEKPVVQRNAVARNTTLILAVLIALTVLIVNLFVRYKLNN
jgi:uncharacterized membrane protein